MTPQLQQAIKLLQLTRLELAEALNQEMMENPVLEETLETPGPEEWTSPLADDETGIQPRKDEDNYDNIDWESFMDSYEPSYYSRGMRTADDDVMSLESTLTKKINLADHLLWQLQLSNMTLQDERLGALIIGNLDDDGYLMLNLEALAQEAGADVEMVERALMVIQQFDPVGVGSRDLRECLSLQLKQYEDLDPIIKRVINEHMSELERKDYSTIARSLKISMERVHNAVRLIHELEPKPGRPFGEERAQYITPDVYVYKVGDEYVIVLNEDGLPKLRISPYYRNLIRDKGKDSDQARDYVQEKLRSAMWLIRSIHQRQRTIYKVTDSIVKHQRHFFDKGIGHLKPMVLRDVAEDISMHESTVSRVTANKYIHTPQGIFPLKYFFNSKINRVEGGSIAAESVRDRIRQIIQSEPPVKPYSDEEIVRRLREYNISIARRTVTKYREGMGVLSSSKRKRLI